MSNDNKISTLIEQQFPDYIRTDGSKLVAFVKAYYQWMEQTGNAQQRINNLLDYSDVDNTLESFVRFFVNEYLVNIPLSIRSDKKLLTKRIQDLYRSKGTENSHKLLFRILFDEEIDFYYPGDYVLKASDGRWVKRKILRVTSPIVGNVSSLNGLYVYGQNSNASARVTSIENTYEQGVFIYTLIVDDVRGEFINGETIADAQQTISATINSFIGPLKTINVTEGGWNHVNGDVVTITSQAAGGGGSGANGNVTLTNDDSQVQFIIVNGGQGYKTDAEITISEPRGRTATFVITTINNTETIIFYTDTIGPMANVIINTGATFVSLGSNTSVVGANLALSNVSSTLASALIFVNDTYGTISEIQTTNTGYQPYAFTTLPLVQVTQNEIISQKIPGTTGFKGNNAVIVAERLSGSILTVSVNQSGSSYTKQQPLTITNTSRANTQVATGLGTPTGTLEENGKYIDTKGFLSWDNKLQDNEFYQQYSYVIKSKQFIDRYRDIVKAIVHPAGTKFFSEVSVNQQLTQQSTLDQQTLDYTVISDQSYTPVSTYTSTNVNIVYN